MIKLNGIRVKLVSNRISSKISNYIYIYRIVLIKVVGSFVEKISRQISRQALTRAKFETLLRCFFVNYVGKFAKNTRLHHEVKLFQICSTSNVNNRDILSRRIRRLTCI